MSKEQLVPWSTVRKGIHLPYDYVQDEAMNFDFIYNISTEDLISLERYCRVQLTYQASQPQHELDWSDTLKFIVVEKSYRQSQQLRV